MNINKIQRDGKLIFVLEGRLDTITAPLLQEALIPVFDEEKHVELDFAKLEYISSAGLRVLLMGQKSADTKGAEMRIKNVLPEVKRVFAMTGFTQMLAIE